MDFNKIIVILIMIFITYIVNSIVSGNKKVDTKQAHPEPFDNFNRDFVSICKFTTLKMLYDRLLMKKDNKIVDLLNPNGIFISSIVSKIFIETSPIIKRRIASFYKNEKSITITLINSYVELILTQYIGILKHLEDEIVKINEDNFNKNGKLYIEDQDNYILSKMIIKVNEELISYIDTKGKQ